MQKTCQLVFLTLLIFVCQVHSHGRMEVPAARNCAWRFGYNTPPNYNDLELNCGGIGQQHLKFGGKCGICGDSMNSIPRPHEVGGRYATGRIVQLYEIGEIIDIKIYISANHLGWMEFRLCPIKEFQVEATHECLEENLLEILNHGTRYPVRANDREVSLKVKLPSQLTCSRCVIQWKYRAGNNWGTEFDKSGLGYGIQEEFYNCADIAIGNSSEFFTSTKMPSTTSPTTTSTTISISNIFSITSKTHTGVITTSTQQTTQLTEDYRNKNKIFCIVDENWIKFAGMLEFCINVCSDPLRNCPLKFCKCHGINAWLKD